MIRAKKVYFQTSKSDLDRLFTCNRESARVWNECLRLAKENHLATGTWISGNELEKRTKRRFAIHSQSIQAVCQKYVDARESAHRSIRKGITSAKNPYRQKKYYNTKWKRQGYQVFENGKITLSLCLWNGKRQKPVVVYASNLPEGQIREIEFCFDQVPYLAISFEDGIQNKSYISQSSASIDLGEIHSIAAFKEQGEAVIITGRKVRSLHRLRNKKLAELSRRQSRCKKGSRQWKRYQKAKRYILSKSARQLQDALHKTTKQFVDWCIEQSISDVYVGDPEGVQRNTRKKKQANRKQAQKLSNWSFGKIKDYLTYKLERQGIQLHLVDEAYTSQTCSVCTKKNNTSSRNYRCMRCGYRQHRDIHGARNILAKSLYGKIQHIDVETKAKYLRIA